MGGRKGNREFKAYKVSRARRESKAILGCQIIVSMFRP